MKLTTTTFVSVDGVMQRIGGPDEDRKRRIRARRMGRGAVRQRDGDARNPGLRRADASLLGRRTYEIPSSGRCFSSSGVRSTAPSSVGATNGGVQLRGRSVRSPVLVPWPRRRAGM